MFDFFDIIVGWLDLLGTMLTNMIDMLMLGLSMIGLLSSVPLYLASMMPAIIGLSMMAVLLIFAIKFFIGR